MSTLHQQTQACPTMTPRLNGDGVTLPLPSEMIAAASRYVVGQERAKRAIASGLYRHYLLLLGAQDGQGDVSFRPGRIMLTGPTGVGKTLLIQTLAKFLGVPYAYASATTLSRTGYIGKKPEDLLLQLLEAAGGDVGRAEQGIIFLDEVDKLKRNDDSFGLDVAGYGAQIDLLPFLDGADVAVQRDKTIHIDTRRLFLVAAGAFVGIERVVERRLQEAGFTGLGPWKGLAGERLVAEHLVPGDVVCYGLCEEFVGRFSVVCTLDPLDADALRAILLEAQGSPLAEAQSFYAMHGIDLEFDDATIDAIVARALTEKAGRGRCVGSWMRCWPMSRSSSRSWPPPAPAWSPWLATRTGS